MKRQKVAVESNLIFILSKVRLINKINNVMKTSHKGTHKKSAQKNESFIITNRYLNN